MISKQGLKSQIAKVKELEAMMEKGMPLVRACNAISLPTATLYDWISKYPCIQERVDKAKANFILFHLENIKKHSSSKVAGNWQASAWCLERLASEFRIPKDPPTTATKLEFEIVMGKQGIESVTKNDPSQLPSPETN